MMANRLLSGLLAYCREKDIARYAEAKQFPIIPCNLCGLQPNLQRQVIKEMLQTMGSTISRQNRNIVQCITKQIVPSHLCDAKLFDFKSIQRGVSLENIEGDIAFDKPDLPTAPLLPDGRK